MNLAAGFEKDETDTQRSFWKTMFIFDSPQEQGKRKRILKIPTCVRQSKGPLRPSNPPEFKLCSSKLLPGPVFCRRRKTKVHPRAEVHAEKSSWVFFFSLPRRQRKSSKSPHPPLPNLLSHHSSTFRKSFPFLWFWAPPSHPHGQRKDATQQARRGLALPHAGQIAPPKKSPHNAKVQIC